MRLPCNVPRRRKNHRVSSSISAEPRPVYIFNRIHRKSGRRGIHCSFGQVKFLLTCKKKERRQKGRNTRTGYIRATQQVRKSVSLSFGLHVTDLKKIRMYFRYEMNYVFAEIGKDCCKKPLWRLHDVASSTCML